MLSVLTVILLLIILSFLLFLFAAIDVVFDLKGSTSSVEHSVTVHWLFFSKQVSPSKEEDEGKSDEIPDEIKDAEKAVTEKVTEHFEEKKDEKGEKKSIDMSFSEMLQAFRELRTPVIRLIKGLINAVKVPYAEVDAVYGFPDPSYTGIACGYSHALISYLGCRFNNLSVRLEPDFADSRLDLDMSGKVRIRLYLFVPVVLLFILNRNVLRFSWNFIIKKKFKKSSVNL